MTSLPNRRDVVDGVLVVEEAALAEQQQMAKAADAVVEAP